ncbi:MAG: hypothetical protein A3J83_02590 [Elusimicrobia bacterium RIFOXYA2_FULL_40_6]|nr:MAG: hypothetical protein A3J83_02590 [Elusimicrobia bacterium RIFOXYA2_FULL_40_6]
MENQKLVDKAKKGDKDAFKELVLAHQARLYNLAFYFTKNEHDASDLYQETWIKVFEQLNKYKYHQNFPAWISQILRNTYIDKFARKQSKKSEVPLDESIDILQSELTPLENSQKLENEAFIDKAINCLPLEYRETVVLIDLQGFSYEETAEITKSPTGTVRSRLNRAREKLKELFKDFDRYHK